MTSPDQHLRGYRAVEKAVERRLNAAEAVRPKRQVDRKSAAYRQGVYDALLTVHCLMAMGSHPRANEQQIQKILQDNSDARTAAAS